MENQSLSFRENMKYDIVPNIVNINSKSNNLLEQLGLNNPEINENMNISISEDKKYIQFSLKESDYYKGPLTFRIPIEKADLSSLYNHPDFNEITNRYQRFKNEYYDKIIDHCTEASKYLHEKFPDLNFCFKIRMKTEPSYNNKMKKLIEENRIPKISDIIAGRIIISNYKDIDDKKILEDMCYAVAEALKDFRENTNFVVQHYNDFSDIPYITKDYIAQPKENGYQSLHITMNDKDNPDLCFETQVRTFDMEEASKKDDKIAHSTYKPRLLNDLSENRIPRYAQITNFYDENGNPKILCANKEQAFYHYYSVPYNIYRKELNKIQELIDFESIREKLEDIRQEKGQEEQDANALCI